MSLNFLSCFLLLVPYVADNDTIAVDINKLHRTIKDVLTSHFARLRDTLCRDDIKPIASEMFSKKLLTKSVRDSPSYEKLINGFEAGLALRKTVQEVEKHCINFINSFSSQGGPVEEHIRIIAQEWKEQIQATLGITLNIL